MNNNRYVIGVDYGTESGRVLLVEMEHGREIASHVTAYPHGVMDRTLPDGQTLPRDWALQHPQDYWTVLEQSIPAVLHEAGVPAEDVIGIGFDFTSCTMLPVDAQGEPLCFDAAWRTNPHSWVKLWKHHAAQPQTDRMNEVAQQRGETFVQRYGGSISCEWMLPKIAQMVQEAPELYAQIDRFVEAGDWVVWQLTGQLQRNACAAGYKGMWHKGDGYPSNDYIRACFPALDGVVANKLHGPIAPAGTYAGGLTPSAAQRIGLVPGTAVAVGMIDAHAAVLGAGVAEPGMMVMAMGTSLCHMLLGDAEQAVEGARGIVEDGIISGFFGYEAGQPAVGDLFAWFVEQAVPPAVHEAAAAEEQSVFAWLEARAARLAPGESGLLALDWWNGNRSILAKEGLSGLIVGYTLQTQPEDVFRALLEATAYGTRRIVESFEEAGVPVHALYASGGIPKKNALLMQLFADITQKPVHVPATAYASGLGAAMLGAVAAGAERGGCSSIADAAARLASPVAQTYTPNAAHADSYDALYAQYVRMHDWFGRGGNQVMETLQAWKHRAAQ